MYLLSEVTTLILAPAPSDFPADDNGPFNVPFLFCKTNHSNFNSNTLGIFSLINSMKHNLSCKILYVNNP